VGRVARITRRTFLIGSAAVAGGVLFGIYQIRRPYPSPLTGRELGGARPARVLSPYLLIDQDGVAIVTPRAEMGQGVHTTLAALVAEELDVPWDGIRTLHGPPAEVYYNGALLDSALPFAADDRGVVAGAARGATAVVAKLLGLQVTGGSTSMVDAFDKIRVAGAAARAVLLQAAAERWGTTPERLGTADGFVVDPENGRRLAYQDLAEAAAAIEPPSDPPLKDRSAWRYLGRSMPRVDMEAKCTGTARFGIDVRLRGMLYATVVASPRVGGGGHGGIDDAAAKAMRGVVRVVDLGDAVAVVANNTWRAFRAAAALRVHWDAPAGSADGLAGADALDRIGDAIDRLEPDATPRDDGDAEGALAAADAIVEAEYRAPFLAHTTMEPMSAVARLDAGELHIWTGHQAPTLLRDLAAETVGLATERVHVHVEYLGGGFGRRAEVDWALQAVRIAAALEGRPVKLTWSREEDVRHDMYRPGAVARCRGVIGADGRPEAVQLKIASPSVLRSYAKRIGLPALGPDRLIGDGAADQPYRIPSYQVVTYAPPTAVPLGNWRSVGASFNGFFHECFLDELAVAAGRDPLAMRLAMTEDQPVAHRVLEAVAELSDWDRPLPEGRGRGLAMTRSFGCCVAEVVEVTDGPDGIRIDRVHCVADVGLALDPAIIEAQLESGILYGLSAAVLGEITFADGRVQQSNFDDYGALRLAQTPQIRVRVLENGPALTGVGEPGTPPSKPALANAVFAATGRRLRSYPLSRHLRFA
jgi:isoquinoline 1-oxidoreductase beta subunit